MVIVTAVGEFSETSREDTFSDSFPTELNAFIRYVVVVVTSTESKRTLVEEVFRILFAFP